MAKEEIKEGAVASSTKHNQKFFIVLAGVIILVAVLYFGYWAGKSGFGMPATPISDNPTIVSDSGQAQDTSSDVVQGVDEVSDDLSDLEDIVK